MKAIYLVGRDAIFHDPGPESLKAMEEADSSFRFQSMGPGPGFVPKFQRMLRKIVRAMKALIDMTSQELATALRGNQDKSPCRYTYSALDALLILVLNSLRQCRLCGWECSVNRYQSTGKCGLAGRTYHPPPFTHVAEEAPINPAVVTNLAGCALRCIYCIEKDLWDTKGLSESDPKLFWEKVRELQNQGLPIISLEFTNPTESLAGVIAILARAPADFNLPVVLNCHLYGSKLFYELAEPITDVWLVDLRYGNDRCAKALSGVEHYMKYAKIGLDAIYSQDARAIVRLLVLPGHVSCCIEPAIELLSEYKDRDWVSILDQFVPEHQAHLDPNLNRRPTKEELSRVESLVDHYGLRNIASGCEDFWTE
jgi:putative pyruvate formate lyase activating enzyme